MIRITEVRIHLLKHEDSNLRAYANITFDGCFVVHGIKVVQGEKGLFIGMPRRKKADGSSQDIAHPITKETRQLVEQRVLEAYHQAVREAQAAPGKERPSPSSP